MLKLLASVLAWTISVYPLLPYADWLTLVQSLRVPQLRMPNPGSLSTFTSEGSFWVTAYKDAEGNGYKWLAQLQRGTLFRKMREAAYSQMHPAMLTKIGNYCRGSVNIINDITIKSQPMQLIIVVGQTADQVNGMWMITHNRRSLRSKWVDRFFRDLLVGQIHSDKVLRCHSSIIPIVRVIIPTPSIAS